MSEFNPASSSFKRDFVIILLVIIGGSFLIIVLKALINVNFPDVDTTLLDDVFSNAIGIWVFIVAIGVQFAGILLNALPTFVLNLFGYLFWIEAWQSASLYLVPYEYLQEFGDFLVQFARDLLAV